MKMQCLRCTPSGPVLRHRQPVPVPPPGEALIRVRLAGICRTDLELARGYLDFSGVLGHEFVGDVEGCPRAPRWEGRRVVGEINCPCGNCPLCRRGEGAHCPDRTVLGIKGRDGCHAEWLTLPAANLHPVPAGLSDERAVFTEPLAAAYRILEQLDPTAGREALVVGDGKLGILCAWVLAGEAGFRVTLLGRHEDKLARARRGTGDRLETRLVESWPHTRESTHRFPVTVEASGSPEGFRLALGATRPGGILVLKSTIAGGQELDLAPLVVDEIRLLGSRCGPFSRALEGLESRRYPVESLITGRYPLQRAEEAYISATARGSLKVLIEPFPKP